MMHQQRALQWKLEKPPGILSKVPVNRTGDPGDVVKAVEFLSCGSSAGYITGQVIHVDGGRSLSQ